jgi:hypothetical protein
MAVWSKALVVAHHRMRGLYQPDTEVNLLRSWGRLDPIERYRVIVVWTRPPACSSNNDPVPNGYPSVFRPVLAGRKQGFIVALGLPQLTRTRKIIRQKKLSFVRLQTAKNDVRHRFLLIPDRRLRRSLLLQVGPATSVAEAPGNRGFSEEKLTIGSDWLLPLPTESQCVISGSFCRAPEL